MLSESEAEDDGGYLKSTRPEKKPLVGLKNSIAIDDIGTGVDFEIDDAMSSRIESEYGDNANVDDVQDNEEYLSDICSRFNPLSMEDADFAALKGKMEDITQKFSSEHKGMIYKRILEESRLSCPAGEQKTLSGLVTMDYSTYLEGQDEPFDSTKKRRHPFTFKIGDRTTLEGLELGVKTMKVGERSQFLVAPELAYGVLGMPGVVPANSEVLFDVILQDCVEGDAIDQIEQSGGVSQGENGEGDRPPLELRLKASKQAFKMGNSRYNVKNYRDALKWYRKASDLVSLESMRDDEEDSIRMALWAKIERGVCRCLYQLAKYHHCLGQCKQVLDYYPEDPIINHLKGQCLLALNEDTNLDAAIRAFQKGLRGKQGSVSLTEALNSAIKKKNAQLDASQNSAGQDTLSQGLRKFCGAKNDDKTTEAVKLKCDAAKFSTRPKPEFKERVQRKVQQIKDGQLAVHSFPSFNLTSLEFDYITCAADDAQVQWEERGHGLVDKAVKIFKT